MYYSKRTSDSVAVPRNYSGSLFRVIDESDRSPMVENERCGGEKFPDRPQNGDFCDSRPCESGNCDRNGENGRCEHGNRPCDGGNGRQDGTFCLCEHGNREKNGCGGDKFSHRSTMLGSLSNILSDISTEELLLLGLIVVIHRDDPNDPILLALLALLVTK